jgi:hypothetical protein
MFIIFSHRKPKTVAQARGNTSSIGNRLSTLKLNSSAPARLDFESHWDKLKKAMKEGSHVV